jgi:hypothetical protein
MFIKNYRRSPWAAAFRGGTWRNEMVNLFTLHRISDHLGGIIRQRNYLATIIGNFF